MRDQRRSRRRSGSRAAPRAAAALAAPAADRMPGDVPTKKTPWVLDGEVYKIVQVGNTMIAGGLFTQVADPMNGTPYARQNLFAFDATTGLVSQTFNPTVDGAGPAAAARARRPTPCTSRATSPRSTTRAPTTSSCSTSTPGWPSRRSRRRRPTAASRRSSCCRTTGSSSAASSRRSPASTHGQFATLNATTGALDPFMDIAAAGQPQHRHRRARRPIGPREAGLTPAGDRMVVIGNFRTVGGLARDQIVMIDLTGATAAVVDRPGTPPATRRSAPPTRSTATCATSRCRRTARTSSSPPPAARTAARCATPPRASRRTPSAPR